MSSTASKKNQHRGLRHPDPTSNSLSNDSKKPKDTTMPKTGLKVNSVTTGSGNVFADLGLPDAPGLLRKATLALDINSRIRARGLTQFNAARILGIDQPKVSALSTGKLSLFSMESLMSYIVALGGEVDVIVREPIGKPSIKVVRSVAGRTYETEVTQPSRYMTHESYAASKPSALVTREMYAMGPSRSTLCVAAYRSAGESTQHDVVAYGD